MRKWLYFHYLRLRAGRLDAYANNVNYQTSTCATKFPNELYSLFLENLDRATLLKCSFVSRDFWFLSRSQIFRDIRLYYDLNLPTPSRVKTFVELLKNKEHPILQFIEIFILVLYIRLEKDSYSGTTEFIELLHHATNLHEVELVYAAGSQSTLPTMMEPGLNALFCLPSLRSISLKDLVNLPATILDGVQAEILELQYCKWSPNSLPLTKSLVLNKLYVDDTFFKSFTDATTFPNLKVIKASDSYANFITLDKAFNFINNYAQTLEEPHFFMDSMCHFGSKKRY